MKGQCDYVRINGSRFRLAVTHFFLNCYYHNQTNSQKTTKATKTVTKANVFCSEFDSAGGVSVSALTRVNKNKYSEDIKLLASGLDSYISGTVEV